MSQLIWMLTAAVCASFGIVLLRLADLRQQHAQMTRYRLHFARDLDAEAVTRFLASLSGLLLPWWRRWHRTTFVVFEIRAKAGGIEHSLCVSRPWSTVIENMLQAHLPGLRYERCDLESPAHNTAAAEYRLSSGQRPLSVDPVAMSSALLANLQPLEAREQIVVQWMVAPHAPMPPARAATPAEQQRLVPPRGAVATNAAALAAMRAKQAHPLLWCVGRIAATAKTPAQARTLVRQAEAAWHAGRVPGVQMRRRLLPQRTVARRVRQMAVPISGWPAQFNVQELCGLLGWPIGVTHLPGIVLSGCRLLPPSPQISATGTVLGTANFPGSERPVAIELEGRLRHLHVIGPTGTGKSTLLGNVVLQDLHAGHGVVLIDAKGDLVEDVLARMPIARFEDVIVFDPADTERPLGLNPLLSSATAEDVAVENLVGVFARIFRSAWGPRSDDIVRAALRTLTSTGEHTLCDVPALLTDPAFRRRLVGQIDDPDLAGFWGWFEGLSEAERMNVGAAPLNKIRAFSLRPRVRAIVGQAAPTWNIADVLSSGKVLLVSLAAGLLGAEAAALLGAMIVAELWHATTARAGIAPDQRRPVMCTIDEWQRVVALPTPMASILAEARGLKLGLVLAHQHMTQLTTEARDAVLANARSRLLFQLPAQDARLLVKEFGKVLTVDDLQGIGAFEAVATVFAGGLSQPPVTVATPPLPPAEADGMAIRERSRLRYGVPRREVELALQRRLHVTAPPAPIGRRRRGDDQVSQS